jgi:hypothetical protein
VIRQANQYGKKGHLKNFASSIEHGNRRGSTLQCLKWTTKNITKEIGDHQDDELLTH